MSRGEYQAIKSVPVALPNRGLVFHPNSLHNVNPTLFTLTAITSSFLNQLGIKLINTTELQSSHLKQTP